MHLTLEANDTHVLKWWDDGAFAVHDGMKSHTGITLTLVASLSMKRSGEKRSPPFGAYFVTR